MKVISKFCCLTAFVALAGCGGGSSGSAFDASSVGSAAPASAAKSADLVSASYVDDGTGPATKQAGVQKLDASWVLIAGENQSFTVPTGTVVQYGANDSWVQRTVSGTATCSNNYFGRDPASGIVKGCYAQTGTTSGGTTPTTPTTPTAPTTTLLANEGASFTVATATTVKYGAGTSWVERSVTGSASCTNNYFGSDPAPNVEKACYSVTTTTAPTEPTAPTAPTAPTTPTTSLLAYEGASFTVATATTVKYGAGTSWIERSVTGSASCTNNYFGSDPAPGVEKACYAVSSTTTTPPTSGGGTEPTTPPPTTGGGTATGDPLTAAAYVAMAAQMGKAAGIEYRYGPTPSAYGTTGNSGRTSLQALPSYPYNPIAAGGNPGGQRSCNPGGWCGTWQIGGPLKSEEGDYSSDIMHVAYVSNDLAKFAGAANLQAISAAHNAFALSPQPSWTTYGSSTEGAEDFVLEEYRSKGLKPTSPVAVSRCYGRGDWCPVSLMVFQNGLIATVGSNTANNLATAQLDANKVPTAITVTNSAEFALITVWDTVRLRGQVAVVALAGKFGWGDWTQLYPGLPNMGVTASMKVLGYVDLPETMKEPTEISAATGVEFETYHRVYLPGSTGGSFVDYSQLPLTTETNRTSFYSGVNKDAIAQAGMAVVISKTEKRAAFVDLRPLFRYYREQYFGGTKTAFDARMASRGPAANQWPYAFTHDASQQPVVARVVDLANRPTAVKMSLTAYNARAWIATQDGRLHIYKLGNYLNSATAGAPADLVEVGSVAVGRNPTGLAYSKRESGDLIVTSRGDRRIDWVRFAADNNSGVTRASEGLQLTDSSLVDPISVEDADVHGTEHAVLSVADYGGSKVSNYRYGPVIFTTNPGWSCQPPNGCPIGSGKFEYGGSFSLPGNPFHVVSANIP